MLDALLQNNGDLKGVAGEANMITVALPQAEEVFIILDTLKQQVSKVN